MVRQMSKEKNIVQMGLLQVLKLIRLGIQNGNYQAAVVVLDELIEQVKKGKEKGEQIRL